MIASPAATDKVNKAAVWSINSPEWAGREYWGTAAEAGTPFRSSDHDPILVGVTAEGGPGFVDINLVTVNDFHGRIEQSGAVGWHRRPVVRGRSSSAHRTRTPSSPPPAT